MSMLITCRYPSFQKPSVRAASRPRSAASATTCGALDARLLPQPTCRMLVSVPFERQFAKTLYFCGGCVRTASRRRAECDAPPTATRRAERVAHVPLVVVVLGQ